VTKKEEEIEKNKKMLEEMSIAKLIDDQIATEDQKK
jgi:hypothetical protein